MKKMRRKFPDAPDNVLTIGDIAKQLNVGRQHVSLLCRNGFIKGAFRASGSGPNGGWYVMPDWSLDKAYAQRRKRA